MNPNATSTANSGTAKRLQEFGAGGEDLVGGALADAAAAADEDAPEALELADEDWLVCSC
jgi:hypothetical protein